MLDDCCPRETQVCPYVVWDTLLGTALVVIATLLVVHSSPFTCALLRRVLPSVLEFTLESLVHKSDDFNLVTKHQMHTQH